MAPTGKAALRLNSEAPEDATWQAETIDRWIWRNGLGNFLSEGTDLKGMKPTPQFAQFDNLVIDEMSMVNLYHLALLFKAIQPELFNIHLLYKGLYKTGLLGEASFSKGAICKFNR